MPAKVKRSSASGRSAEQRPSIVAVAAAAQVSIATVSRVLNQRGTVAPKLEKRVKEAILQTGYLPNVAARSLSSGRSRTFGVIISNLTNPFFPELLQSFEEAAVALGYEVLVASTAYDVQRMTNCIDRMLGRKVDGVAVMTFGIEGPLLNRFVDRSIPLVFMDEAPEGPNLFSIAVDYQTGIRQAIQHLAILGHRRIAFVCGPEQQSSVARRRAAVEQAFQEIGLQLAPELIFLGDHSLQSGQLALEAFLRLENPPTAIFCSNDLSAMGVMLAAGQLGISIPDDLSLIGFDGIDLGGYIFPMLTSVMMSRKQIADAAVQALWRCVEGSPIAELKVDTQLLIRRTTSHPRGSLDDLRVQRSAR